MGNSVVYSRTGTNAICLISVSVMATRKSLKLESEVRTLHRENFARGKYRNRTPLRLVLMLHTEMGFPIQEGV